MDADLRVNVIVTAPCSLSDDPGSSCDTASLPPDLVSARLADLTLPQNRLGVTCVAQTHDAPAQGFVRIWAPFADTVDIVWSHPCERDAPPFRQPLTREPRGYFTGVFEDLRAGDHYSFSLDGVHVLPDPASRFQPDGVFGSSSVVSQEYPWTTPPCDGGRVPPATQWVIYEVHTGTFTQTGDFAGIIADLPRLKDLGITALEIMPVAQFSGRRNWGYDGVFPFAAQNSYGGPSALKALVDAAHGMGIAVILDVVYNHLGPEGNVLFRCAPYVQDKYKTPWGESLNFDGPHSEEVRRYFLQNAWQWLTEFRFDGLRLDAVQTIFDTSPVPFLEELSHLKAEAEKVRGCPLTLIAETDANDPRLLAPPAHGGLGMDGHWSDDLHHALHAILTGERGGYYADYGDPAQIARIYRDGVAFQGDYSMFRVRRHGRPYGDIDMRRLVVESQNHDQTGNRMNGERLSALLGDFEKLKLCAACVLLSPFMPLLFMGEEWAEEKPFLYIVDHEDPLLTEQVRTGRAAEFADFGGQGAAPDPACVETFARSTLGGRDFPEGSRESVMQACYRNMIALSKMFRARDIFATGRRESVWEPERKILFLGGHAEKESFLILFSFSQAYTSVSEADLAQSLKAPRVLFCSADFQVSKPPPAFGSSFVSISAKADSLEGVLELPPFSATVLQGLSPA